VTTLTEPGALSARHVRTEERDELVIVFVAYDAARGTVGRRALNYVEQISTARRTVVVADLSDPRVERLQASPWSVIRYGGGGLDYDGVFEQLLVALLGPLPTWLELRTSPSLVVAPTGVSWWSDELLVADEHGGQVVRLGSADTRMIVGGLREPHHIHLDRHKLLIADKGGQRVLIGEVYPGGTSSMRTLSVSGGLLHPNGVHQAEGLLVIADTDHHRVLMTADDPWASRRRPSFSEIRPAGGFRYPCGVFVDREMIWIADTFHHRLVVTDHSGREWETEFTGYGWAAGEFAYPTSVARWRDKLVVADAEARRIQVLGLTDNDSGRPQLTMQRGEGLEEGELARPWIGNPFGLSINRDGRMAIGDRLRRCVWLVDLAGLAEGWGSD